jgi:3-oxoacyl-[acyl-carrier protein] reductase
MSVVDGFRLDGRVVIVTGAARGIGAACADAVEGVGATVVRVDVLEGAGVTACDVSDKAAVDTLVDGVVATHGRLDGIANVAGIIADGGVVELTEADLDRILAVNLKGVLFGCQAAVRHMRTKGGAIVNMASAGGVLPAPTVAGYGMSKAAVISLTRSLAQEVGAQGIRVNAVAPGFTITPMTTRNLPADDPAALDRLREHAGRANPMHESVEPDDLAGAVLYLLSDVARHVTVQVLHVNAGILMSS